MIYEVKYWKKLSPSHISEFLLQRLIALKENYNVIAHHNSKVILMVVLTQQQSDRMKTHVENYSIDKWVHSKIEIQFLAKEKFV